MRFTTEHIQQLLIEKLTGTINDADSIIIERLLVEDRDVIQQWESLRKQVALGEKNGFFVDGDRDKGWELVGSAIRKSRIKRISFLAAAVAASLSIAVLGNYLFNGNPPATPIATKPLLLNKNNISLSLDNGKTVLLKDTGTAMFLLGNATVNTFNKELAFIQTRHSPVVQWGTLSVPAVFDYKITLADGTEVWMNSETTLRFPFDFQGNSRQVYLKGEAYFKVTKDPLRPFIVHANQTSVRVLGTSFNVNSYDSIRVATALVEGSVTAVTKGKILKLEPGFEATYNPAQQQYGVSAFDRSEVLSWLNGVYHFHNTPLKELGRILSRWYDVRIEFSNATLQHKTFSGEISKKQSIQLFLENLKISNKINFTLKDGVLTFE